MQERTTSWDALRFQKAVRYAARLKRVGIYLPSEGSGILNDAEKDPPDRHLYNFVSVADITSNIIGKRSVGDIVNGDPTKFGMKT